MALPNILQLLGSRGSVEVGEGCHLGEVSVNGTGCRDVGKAYHALTGGEIVPMLFHLHPELRSLRPLGRAPCYLDLDACGLLRGPS